MLVVDPGCAPIVSPMFELSSELIRVFGLAAGWEALLEEFAISLLLLDITLF
jgi:hypothetical protein